MNDTKAPDQGLMLADDGRMHTTQCVQEGWALLDWDVDCVVVGTPQGGPMAALAERALFSTAVVLLPVATALANVLEVSRGR